MNTAELALQYVSKHWGHIENNKPISLGYMAGYNKATIDHLLIVEALEELVQLKEWKEKHGKDEHYLANKDRVWENAIKALNEKP